MICFSLFLDNGDTFQFGIPLKVYKCIFKNISASIILLLYSTNSSYITLLFSNFDPRPTK